MTLLSVSCLTYITLVCEAIDHGKEIRVIFCDVSKTFHRVCHKGIILKYTMSV